MRNLRLLPTTASSQFMPSRPWRMACRRSASWRPCLASFTQWGRSINRPKSWAGLIGAALVGTFVGIFFSYAIVAPIAQKIKVVRQKQLRLFTLVKLTLLAYMNGAMPQVAVEFGRKTIPSKERPTIDVVESETTTGGPSAAPVIKEAA